VATTPRAPVKLSGMAGAVWVPGLGLAVSGVGFGAVTTFVVLLFAEHGWGPAWLAFTALSVAFIVGRLAFGHLPDRVGGAKVALVCVVIEALGLLLIWAAPWYSLAVAGVALTGLGYSLVYPGFGVEAVRRAPPESRGLAMGTYTAFLDLSLALTGPVLGMVADHAGLGAVFLVSMLVVLCSAGFAARLVWGGTRGACASGRAHAPAARVVLETGATGEATMPHVIVKLWPGGSEAKKRNLADRITQAVTDVLGYGEEAVSVAFEEVSAKDWAEEVYKPDIVNKPEALYKKPGYDLSDLS